jgi:ATP-dependent helicase/DNAse subunit B
MAEARFHNSRPNSYSGTLSHPPIVAKIAEEFGAKKVFSPTSLETYVACPFRFWLEKVLGVEPLEEPAEDVDVSRRGSTIHRTLKRYHEAKPHERPEAMAAELETTWGRAVGESADRAPSAAVKSLWRLERRRVQRAFNRYPVHWEAFRGGWRKQGATPTPHEFEAVFGYEEKGSPRPELKIVVDDVEVRIGGIIDRIDVAELDAGFGFWIIDYKTGSGTQYRASDLQKFERLQLPLYALAVERLFGQPMRPLGLAYWLIVKDGPKLMLPDGRRPHAWAKDAEEWPKYREQLERVVARVAQSLRSGDFRLAPRRDDTCEYCPHGSVCRINQQRDRLQPLPLVDDNE